MTHQAIARKWRPQLFEEIVGQRHVTRTLQNAIRLDRIHHAFLLTGARGVGKTSAARILARALNCEQGPAENPCNECSSCTDMLAGTFPDVVEIDAASHNSVDDIRDLVEKARYTPQRGRYKVYIVDEVHMVSKAGFNALLKTLEEPPAHVIFILATTDPQKLLDTVVSRCQRFDFKMIPVRTVFERLRFVAEQEGVQVPESSLMVIAREGGGSMRDAQSLLDQVLSFAGDSVSEDEISEILGFIDRSILYEVLEATLEGEAGLALEALAKVATFGYDVGSFSKQLLESVRNVALVQQVRDGARLLDLPDDECKRIGKLTEGRNAERLRQQFDILASTVHSIAHSEQPMILLEMAVVKMASVRDFVPIRGLLGRLENLERRLRKLGGGATDSRSGSSRPSRAAPPRSAAPMDTFPDERGSSAPPPPPPFEDEAVPAARGPARSTAPQAPTREPAPPRAAPPSLASPAAKVSEGGGDIVNQLLSYKRGQPSQAPSAPAAAPPQAPPATPPAQQAAPEPPPAAAPTQAPPAPEAASAPEPPAATEATASSTDAPVNGQSAPASIPIPESPEAPAAAPTPSTAEVEAAARPAPTEPPPAPSPSAEVRAESPTPTRPDPPGSELCDAPRWRRFVHDLGRLEGLGPAAAVLARSGFLGTSDSAISIGFQSQATARRMDSVAEHPTLLASLSESFGEGTTLSWSHDPEGRSSRTLSEELELRRNEMTQNLDTSARNDPAVVRTMELFPGAKIEKVSLPKNLEIKDVR